LFYAFSHLNSPFCLCLPPADVHLTSSLCVFSVCFFILSYILPMPLISVRTFFSMLVFYPSQTGATSLSETSVFACGAGPVVGTATGYGRGGRGIESRWGRDFPHLSRPALGPIQPPVQ
jgi:hypothetical protein